MDILKNKFLLSLFFIFIIGSTTSFSLVLGNKLLFTQKASQTNKHRAKKIGEDKSNIRWVSYSLILGRKRKNLNLQRKYTFSLPRYMKYRMIGEDASSGTISFIKNNEVVFNILGTDYILDRDYVKISYPGACAISFVGGHTNILKVFKKDLKELKLFIKYFKIDGQQVFK